jgi:hypothetical protein
VQIRAWKGMNLTDSRVAIDDEELFWSENAMTIGKGAIQILPAQGAAIATIAAGVSTLTGFTLTITGTSTPVLIAVSPDGSIRQIKQDGTVTVIAAAGAVTTAARMTIFRDGPILIIDPVAGYSKWTGATYTVIDATKLGTSIAVFEGRVWISNGVRTVIFTAPSTVDDFTAGNGAGSTIITDNAFPGNITCLASALEQLWVIGAGAIEAIANVAATGSAPSVVTTFSVTNIVTGLGTNADSSSTGYFRALTFMAPFGEYALSGVTPQKLSDKLDGLFKALTLGDAPVAVAVVENLLTLMFLVTYTPSASLALPLPASGLDTAQKIVLCFANGKHFVATQGALVWITTLLVDGVSQAWGTNGSTIYRLFAADADEDVAYKIVSKLYDHGLATTTKAETKFGFEFQAPLPIEPTVTIDNEISSQLADINFGNEVTWINEDGDPVEWINNVNDVVVWVGVGMVLSRATVAMFGRYLGFTIQGEDPPYRIQAIQTEVHATREWEAK